MTEVNPSTANSAANPKTKTVSLPAESKFLGITEKSQSAVFELSTLSGEKSKIKVSKDQILGEVKSILSGEKKIEEVPYLRSSNFNAVVNAYHKQKLLPETIIDLIKARRNRAKAEAISKPEETEPKKTKPEPSTTDTVVSSKDDTDSIVKEPLASENFAMRADKETFLTGLFSNQSSKSKMLTEDLAPHFRHILGNPNLTDKEIRETKTASTSNSQQARNLQKLRDSFLQAVVKNETASLPVWLKSDLGTQVSENIEPVLYDVASHVHRQVLHQLNKGKEADQKVIDNQIQAYIRSTNILASIVKRQKITKPS